MTTLLQGVKFGRTYSLRVQTTSDTSAAIDIVYPLTLNLDVSRSTLSNANRGFFKIMNLSESTRRKIFHDRYDIANYRRIILSAGYETDPKLPVIFRGNILFAQSYRQKQDWVTEIEALDGGFGIMNGQVSMTAQANYDLKSTVETIIKGIPNVVLGAIGGVGGANQSSRGVTFMGNSWDILNSNFPDKNLFSDLERVSLLNKNEYIVTDNDPFIISEDTGLLETPRRGDKTLELKIMFEPRIFVGQQVQVLSTSLPYFNGTYIVQGVSHRGTISGAVGGELTSYVTVYSGNEVLKGIVPSSSFFRNAA